MKNKIVASLLLFIGLSANAESYINSGLGLSTGPNSVGLLSVGYQEKVLGSIYKQFEAGFWTDSNGFGRNGSGFGAASLGLEVLNGILIVKSSLGVSAITSPDSMLGGWFQFTEDAFIGVHDGNGNIISVGYKHFSSAGIYTPNKGRDFILLHAEIPW